MVNEILFQGVLSDPSRTAVGWAGEAWVDAVFSQNPRYKVERMKIRSQQGDLKVIDTETGECFRVEVKTARRSSDRKWRFTLYKAGHTDHSNADFVVLLAVRKTGVPTVFIIPQCVTANKSQISISRDPDLYQGQYAKWRLSRRQLHTVDLADIRPSDVGFTL